MPVKTVKIHAILDYGDCAQLGIDEPIQENGDLTFAKDHIDICGSGFKQLFGVPMPKINEIIRISLTLEAIEKAQYVVKTEYKPYAPVKPKAKAKAKATA